MKTLSRDFFDRSAVLVARELIGKTLARRTARGIVRGIVTETEAYEGPHDRASHASRGRTERTKIMFGPPGHFYVYFTYGMHYMLNIVTGPVGHPAAVLIRSVSDITGPGRLTKKLKIDKRLNGARAARSAGLWFEDAKPVLRPKIEATPRIGVASAGPEWAGKKYRFLLKH